MFVCGVVVTGHRHVIGPEGIPPGEKDGWMGRFSKESPTLRRSSGLARVCLSAALPSELPLAPHPDARAGDTTINVSLKSARSLFCRILGSTFFKHRLLINSL